MEGNPYGYQNPQSQPPEVRSIKDMVKLAGLLALIFGIINILWGVVGLLVLVGIVGIIFGIIDLIMWKQCDNINKLMDQGRYEEAKSKTMLWMIIGIVLGGFIPGLLLLIAYLKFDQLTRPAPQQYGQGQQYAQSQQPGYVPPPPPPPETQQAPSQANEGSSADSTEERLRKLKALYEDGVIDEEEYKRKKEEILSTL